MAALSFCYCPMRDRTAHDLPSIGSGAGARCVTQTGFYLPLDTDSPAPTGRSRLDQALAAASECDTLVVAQPRRLAGRSPKTDGIVVRRARGARGIS